MPVLPEMSETGPGPLIALLKVGLDVRSKVSAELLTTLPVPSEPPLPPFPICSVPALIVVTPE